MQLWFPQDDATSSEKRNRYHFDIRQVLLCVVRKFKSVRVKGRWRSDFDPSPDGDMPEIIAGAASRTRNGKTLIKVLAIVVGHLPGVCSIIISNTNKASTPSETRSRSTSIAICIPSSNPTSNTSASSMFHQRHPRLISNASRTIDKARALAYLGEDLPFQLILDEADSYYRRSSKPIQLELALENIQAKIRPILRWSVSATLIPVLLHLNDKQIGVDCNSSIYTQPDEK